MKKTLISSVIAFAIVLSAGMSAAGPLRDNSQRGYKQEVYKSIQRGSYITKKANAIVDAAKPDYAYGSAGNNWSSEFPSVVFVPIEENGNYTWVFGKTSGFNLSNQQIWMNYR
jgi:hypothetical protein